MDNEQQVFSEQQSASSFKEIKEVASKNIHSLLEDLHDFEVAIREEKIQEIYRIYNGRLHQELKKTSNQHNEIDTLLSQKLHESLMTTYPFMRQVKKVSPTVYHYQIDQYYHERPTIFMDASVPALFVLPEIKEEWTKPLKTIEEELQSLEEQMDSIEAKKINARVAVKEIDDKLLLLKNVRLAIEQNRGFFNRGKIEEDLEAIQKKQDALHQEKETWIPYLNSPLETNEEKEHLVKMYEEKRLKRAIIIKELRLITQHFGSYEVLEQQLSDFLINYLNGEE